MQACKRVWALSITSISVLIDSSCSLALIRKVMLTHKDHMEELGESMHEFTVDELSTVSPMEYLFPIDG